METYSILLVSQNCFRVIGPHSQVFGEFRSKLAAQSWIDHASEIAASEAALRASSDGPV